MVIGDNIEVFFNKLSYISSIIYLTLHANCGGDREEMNNLQENTIEVNNLYTLFTGEHP
jgi:hypothetical protein